MRAGDGSTAKFRISDLTADANEPYQWASALITDALVTSLKATGAQVVLVDTSEDNVNWDDLTFKSVSADPLGQNVTHALMLQGRRLRAWRGDNEVSINVGTTPGATYQLPVIAESDRWVGLDADSATLYALRAGAGLHLARSPYRLRPTPAHYGVDQQLRAVITAGPATGKLWDSDSMAGVGSVAAGADLALTAGLTIGSVDINTKPVGGAEVARMEIVSGGGQELNISSSPAIGSFTGDNRLKAGLTLDRVAVTQLGSGNSQYVQLGLNRPGSESESFNGWRTTAGEGLGKSWYVVNPDGTYLEFRNEHSYSSGSSWLNIQSGHQTVVESFAVGEKFTLVCADSGGLSPHTEIILKRNAASTIAITAWITHEATHSFYYVSPAGVVTELPLSTDSPTTEQMYWLVPDGPARPTEGQVFKIVIARKDGLNESPVDATIDEPTILNVPTTSEPDGVPVAMSIRDNRLSILYSQGSVSRFSVGSSVVARVAPEDIDTGQYIDPSTPSTLLMSDYVLLHQASDFISKWTIVLGGSSTSDGAVGGGGGAGGAGGGVGGDGLGGDTATTPGRVRQIFFARGELKPDAPDYRYLGSGGYSPEVTSTSVWQGHDPNELSIHPLWMATAESVEQESGAWVTSMWTIVSVGSFAVRYAQHLTLNASQISANWHGPPQIFGQDRWMQIRDDTGAWGAPIVIARGPYVDPWFPLVTGHYIGAYSQTQIMNIYGNGNLYGRKELLFQIRLFDTFAEPTTDPITTWKGNVQNTWAKLSTSLNFPVAPYLSNAAKDEYAFCLTAHRRKGLDVALNSATTNFYDIAGLQATIWVRFVHDGVSGPWGYSKIQVFGFDKLYNRGFLDISMR